MTNFVVGGTLPAGFAGARTIAYGAGLFVALYGTIAATSPDGITWTERSLGLATGESWSRLTFANGRFVAVSSQQFSLSASQTAITSTDGINWTASTLPFFTTWSDVVFGAGLFLAVSSSSGRAATSPNGTTWTARTLVNRSWGNVVYGNGRFVITPNGTSQSNEYTQSTDGISFSFSGLNGIYLPVPGAWSGSVFANSKFVLVSNAGASNNGSSNLVSFDGISWSIGALPLSPGPGSYSWTDVTFGDGTYIAMASQDIAASSADGLVWTPLTVPPSTLYQDIAYGAGVFATVSSNTNASAIYDPNGQSAFWQSFIGTREVL